jgi:preprotein translocase subunit SecB
MRSNSALFRILISDGLTLMTDVPVSDTEVPAADQGAQNAQPGGFRILTQYVRDLSFENPKAPESLRLEGKPAIDMGVELNAQGRPDGLFEVDIRLNVKATSEQTPVFNIELVYGGLFQLNNVAPADIEPMLLIECPRYLFPFAREIVARATSDGGFYPPFMMDPIDFVAIYMARQQQMAANADAQPGQA